MKNGKNKTYCWIDRITFPVILGLVCVVFGQSFLHTWAMDDFPVIVENIDIRSLADFFENAKPGRPLRELTYLLDYTLFGLNPVGWHIQNILWHGLNGWLLFFLVRRLDNRIFVAWSVVLLWVVHPLVVEVVANTSHRKDSLALSMSLLALHSWISFSLKPKRKKWLVAALICFGLALGAKQNVVMLPVVIWAYEQGLACHEPVRLKRLRLFFLVSGALSVLGGMVGFLIMDGERLFHDGAKGLLAKMNYFDDWSLSFYYQAVLKSWAFMFSRVIWPFDLAVEYTYPLPTTWLNSYVLAALALIIVYIAGLCWSWKREPLVFFALTWCGALWLPTSNLWPLAYFAADRYLYAPLVGMVLLGALLLNKMLASTGPLVKWGTLTVLILSLGILSFQQTAVWQNPQTLWTQANKVSPTSAFALNNLGNIALQRGENGKAMKYYQKSFSYNPYNPSSNYNLGFLYTIYGDRASARKHLKNFLVVADQKEYEQERAVVERQLQNSP